MEFFIKKTLAKAIKNSNNKHEITPLKQSQEIAFLYSKNLSEDGKRILNQWKKGLENANKVIQEVILMPNKLKKGEEAKTSPLEIYKNDFSFTGTIKSPKLLEILQKKYDYLILFEAEPSLEIQLIAAKSKAKLRIGKNTETNQKVCDFLINIPENADMESYILNLEKTVKAIAGG